MRQSFIFWFLLVLGPIALIRGLDQEGSGSGLEEEEEEEEEEDGSEDDSLSYSNFADYTKANVRHGDSQHASYVFHPDISPWGEAEPELRMLESETNFLEHKEMIIAVICGGVTGALLAVAITALIIRKWQKEDEEFIFYMRRKKEEEKEEEYQRARTATTEL